MHTTLTNHFLILMLILILLIHFSCTKSAMNQNARNSWTIYSVSCKSEVSQGANKKRNNNKNSWANADKRKLFPNFEENMCWYLTRKWNIQWRRNYFIHKFFFSVITCNTLYTFYAYVHTLSTDVADHPFELNNSLSCYFL